MSLENLEATLQEAFDASTKIYEERGFRRRIGFGKKPALISVDLANAWTRPGYRFSCNDMDEQIIPGVQRLNEAARAKRVPIIYTSTAFCSRFDMGAFPLKTPFEDLMLGTPATEIDSRIAPEDGIDTLIIKKRPSAFAGTHLAGILRAGRIDTLICTGVTMAGCVRHTVEDALGEGFRSVVVRECIGDRVPAAIEWNLFDLDMKYCDVEPLEHVLGYLNSLEPFANL